jgi:hypothetical protein
MWVWTDELFREFPDMGPNGDGRLPLLAVAVGSEADLESVARDVIGEYQATGDESPAVGDRTTRTSR